MEIGFSISGSSLIGETWVYILLALEKIGMEALIFIYNFCMMVETCSSFIIGDRMDDIGLVGEPNWGVEKGIANFSSIGDGGRVHSGDESMTMFFLLSFLEILRH